MPFSAFKIDDSVMNIAASGGAIRIPEGEYLFTVGKITPSPETKDKPNFRVQLTVKDGNEAGKGRSLSVFCSFSPNAMFRLGQLYWACGKDQSRLLNKDVPNYKAFVAFAEALQKSLNGAEVGGLVADREYQGKVTSDIIEFYPAKDFASRSQFQPQTTATAPVEAVPSILDEEIDDL
jgi:hypothetical protein